MFQFNNPYQNHFYQVPNPRSQSSFDIPGGLQPGKQIFISGRVLPNTDSFAFNLCTPSGIAFHINPRFHLGCIVRNTDRGGWGPEERAGPFPFGKGQQFELVIAVDHDRYRVAINGAHAFEYNHRVPFQEVTRLQLEGEMEIFKIIFSGAGGHGGSEVHNPSLPCDVPLVNGAIPGRMIQIHGQTFSHTNRFHVNLQSGTGDSGNVAVTFNPRWDDPYTGSVVVRTNRRNGGWGNEDRAGNNPFPRGGPFEILIYLEHGEWRFAVNGQHYCSFPHRQPFQEVTHIRIEGNVQINSIRQF